MGQAKYEQGYLHWERVTKRSSLWLSKVKVIHWLLLGVLDFFRFSYKLIEKKPNHSLSKQRIELLSFFIIHVKNFAVCLKVICTNPDFYPHLSL